MLLTKHGGRRRGRGWPLALGVALGVLVARPAWPAWPAVPSQVLLRAAIFLRAMAYERGLAADPAELKLAVLRGQAADDEEAVAAFGQLAKTMKVANRPLALTVLSAANRAEALTALRTLQPQVIYVPAQQKELLAQVSQAFAESRAIVLCADARDIDHGCLLAVEQEADKMRVVVHLSLAQRLGLHFDGRLLQLSRVVSD